MDTIIKNVKLAELNLSITNVVFEYTNFKYDLLEYK